MADIGEEYLGWLRDPEVTRYLETGNSPATLDSMREYLKRFEGSSTDLIFAIVDQGTNKHVGNVTLNHISPVHRTTATGLMIGRKEFWGKGIAFEGWSLVIEYAFQRLGMRKILAGVVSDHAASVKTLKNLGFQVEGTFKKEVLVDGEFRDKLSLGLFREEFHGFRDGSTSG
jgi:RimJ/RimL family protein N-acetyltransferase